MAPLFLGCSFLAVAVLAMSGAIPPGRNQQDRSVATSATRIVSPSVLATWIAKRDDRGRARLDLLVLWRGASGWFARRPAGERTSGGGSGTFSITLIRGELQLQLSFDIKKRMANVGGTDVPLDKNNVILVDDVDVPNGGKILGRYQVDPAMNDPTRIDPIVRRSPALIEYLRCDAPIENDATAAALAHVCAMILGK